MFGLLRRLLNFIIGILRRLFNPGVLVPSPGPVIPPPGPGPAPGPVNPANSPPRATIQTPASGQTGPEVTLNYTLFDNESNRCNVTIEFSTDGGNSFQPASDSGVAPSEGAQNLTAAPGGVTHVFVWNAVADLPAAGAGNVIVQLTPADADMGAPVRSNAFAVSPNTPAAIVVTGPVGQVTGAIVDIDFTITDAQSDPIDIIVEYSLDQGSTFLIATDAAISGSSGVQMLASSPAGMAHTFKWDAGADLQVASASAVIAQIRPAQTSVGTGGRSQAFDIVPQTPPSVFIVAPGGGVQPALVDIRYRLIHPASEPVDIQVEYSSDGQLSFHAATAIGGDGVSQLSSSPTGTTHTFIWDAGTDLGPQALVPGVVVRMRAAAASVTGSPDTSQPFTVDFMHPGAATPQLKVFAPEANVGPHVPVHFIVAQPDNLPVDIDVRVNGQVATPAPISDRMTNLAAPSVGADYRFVWDAAADMGVNFRGSVQLELTAASGSIRGPVKRVIAQVDAVPRPLPADPIAKVQIFPFTLSKTAGDQQAGITGELFQEALKIQVTEATGSGVFGVPIDFRIISGDIELEDDSEYSTVTNVHGIAAVRVRAKPGFVGSAVVETHVVGLPDFSNPETYTLTIHKARIVQVAGAAGSVRHGHPVRLTVTYDGDNNLSMPDFAPDPLKPIAFDVSAQNAIVSTRKLTLTHWYQNEFFCVPTILNGTARITLTHPTDPSIDPLHIDLTVDTPFGGARLINLWNYPRNQFLKMHFEPLSGLGTNGEPQIGFPGMSLNTPFRARLTDENGETYNRSILAYVDECNQQAVETPLVVWWEASSGTLSASPGPGQGNTLGVDIESDVYFTPDGPGPWTLTVSYGHPTQGVYVSDPNPRTFTSTPPPSRCYRPAGFTVYASYQFIVRTVEDIQWLDTGQNPPAPVTEFKPGQRVKLQLQNFSELGAGTPGSVNLTGLRSTGYRPPDFAPPFDNFSNTLTLTKTDPATLESEEVLIVQGDPGSVTANKTLGVLPRGLVRVEAVNVDLTLPVKPRKARVTKINDVVQVQDNATGTSVRGGAYNNVVLKTGEFTLDRCDLNFTTRAGEVMLCRSYRNFLDSDGPLGPGWFFSPFEWLDVAHGGGEESVVYWHHGSGRVDHFKSSYWYGGADSTGRHDYSPPRGLLYGLANGWTVDNASGAFTISDGQGGTTAFNPDGSIRFVRDRFDNYTRYHYNERAQLIRITDCHDRDIHLSYYTEQTAPVDEIVGRLHEVTDFANRTVTYEYYDGNGPGGKGWLKKVSMPAAPTLDGQNVDPNYRRSETYEYEADPDVGWRMVSVLNSRNEELLRNAYDSQSRVQQQHFGNADYAFAYSMQGQDAVTLQTDRGGNETEFVFHASPLADGTTPKKITVRTNRNVDPAEPDYVYEMEHNYDGMRTRIKQPDNSEFFNVYDETGNIVRRDNLLALRQKLPSGKEKIISYEYDYRYNVPEKIVDERGNHPDVDSDMFTTRYQINPRGLITGITMSRALNLIMDPGGGSQPPVPEWLADNPKTEISYNAFHLKSTHIDEMGVKTRFLYYPADNPAGRGGAAASVDGGGFLGKIEYDVEDTPKRNRFLPNTPRRPSSIGLGYNMLGNLTSVTDADGVVTEFTVNDLGELNEVTAAAQVPTTIPRTPAAKTEFVFDSNGGLARSTWTGSQGNPVIETRVNSNQGIVREKTLSLNNGMAKEQWLPDNNDQTDEYISANAQDFADAKIKVVHDERGYEVRQTAGKLEITTKFANNGVNLKHKDVNGDEVTVHVAEDGYPDGMFDSAGTVFEIGNNQDNEPQQVVITSGGTGTDFNRGPRLEELLHIRRDEQGRMRRTHQALFLPDEPNNGRPIPALPDNRLLMDDLPNVIINTDLPGGAWGPDDGYTTIDQAYDMWGLPARLVDDENGVVYIHRESYQRPALYLDSSGNSIFFDRYATGRIAKCVELAQYVDINGQPATRSFISYFDYDGLGNLYRTVDGEGNTQWSGYDDNRRIVATYDAMGPDSAENYRGLNIPNFTLNERGNVTTYERDNDGRITRIEATLTADGRGGGPVESHPFSNGKSVQQFEYFPGGDLKIYTDNAGYKTEWKYDTQGRLEKIEYKNSAGAVVEDKVITYKNNTTLRETAVDNNGTILRNVYNGRQIERTEVMGPPGPRVIGSSGIAYTYDGSDDVETMTDISSNYAVGFKRNSHGELMEDRQGNGNNRTTKFAYDGNGRRTRIEYPSGAMAEYRYTPAGQLTQIRFRNLVVAEFEYIGNERLLHRNQLGVRIKYEHNRAGVVTGIDATRFANASDSMRYVIERDRMQRIKRTIVTRNGQVHGKTFSYDSIGRIVKEETRPHPAHNNGVRLVERFWDGDDVLRREILEVRNLGGFFTQTDDRNRGLRGRVTTQGNSAFQYDNNGNLMHDGEREFWYDAWSRLTKIAKQGEPDVIYDYDPLGRLIKKTRGTFVEEYFYDNYDLIEVRRSGHSERYVYTDQVDDPVLVEINGSVYTFLRGPEGHIDALIDDNRNIVESYRYSLRGEVTVYDVNGQYVNRPPRSRLLFQSRPYDPDTGLYHFRFRWYHPRSDQFLTPDPAGYTASSNQYGFCTGDPVNAADPLGLMGRAEAAGKAAAGAVWGLFKGLIVEPVLAVVDVVGVTTELATGGWYRHDELSGAGKMTRGGMGYGDFFAKMGQGIIGTPQRAWNAMERGDAFAFGEEAMNFYMIARPVATQGYRTAGTVRNYGSKLLARTSRARARSFILSRRARVQSMSEAVRQSRGIDGRLPDDVTFRYRFSQPRFRNGEPLGNARLAGEYTSGNKTVTIFEEAFTPGMRSYMPRIVDSFREFRSRRRLIREDGIDILPESIFGYLGLQRIIKRNGPFETVRHEAWHALQDSLNPEFFNTPPSPLYGVRITEFNQPWRQGSWFRSNMPGWPRFLRGGAIGIQEQIQQVIMGAHNFELLYAPGKISGHVFFVPQIGGRQDRE